MLLACQQAPVRHDAASRPRDAAIAIDATVSPATIDAGVRACARDEPGTRAFRFGTLTAPAGWCWRRTAEGDDMGGILVDDHARVRMSYDELAFGDKVGDACKAGNAIRDAKSHGVAYRTCTLAGGRHCYSFRGLANLCTETAEDLDLTPMLAPKR